MLFLNMYVVIVKKGVNAAILDGFHGNYAIIFRSLR